ncbi:MAG: pyroglutamyl-peptidase I [Eubacteriales bacterium]|nr:pyroglutamyl-peptidase I [Eubacteriales bacterium]
MRILLTGFQPFDKDRDNASWQTAQAVRCPQGHEMRRVELPVTFDTAFALLRDVIECFCPDVVVSLGQATGRTAISVELFGVNWRDARIPDNDGAQPQREKIAAEGETAYMSNLPVYEMIEAMREAGFPAYVSFSAGGYVCNEILYSTSHFRKEFERRTGKTYRNGFIHLPLMREQALDHPRTAFMEVETMAAAVEKALEVIVNPA